MRFGKRTHIAAVVVAAGALVVGGVAVAGKTASDDKALSQLADAIRSKDAFTDAVAKELGTSGERLRAAILAAAGDRIDAAEKAGSITEADATTLRTALTSGDRLAMRIATGAAVAAKLGVTEAKLDAAWGDATKAQAIARIDQGVKDGWITEKQAEVMRARVKDAKLPGYGFGGHGLGGRGHGHWGPGRAGEGGGIVVPEGTAKPNGIVAPI